MLRPRPQWQVDRELQQARADSRWLQRQQAERAKEEAAQEELARNAFGHELAMQQVAEEDAGEDKEDVSAQEMQEVAEEDAAEDKEDGSAQEMQQVAEEEDGEDKEEVSAQEMQQVDEEDAGEDKEEVSAQEMQSPEEDTELCSKCHEFPISASSGEAHNLCQECGSSPLDLDSDSASDDPSQRILFKVQFALIAHVVITFWSSPLLQMTDVYILRWAFDTIAGPLWQKCFLFWLLHHLRFSALIECAVETYIASNVALPLESEPHEAAIGAI